MRGEGAYCSLSLALYLCFPYGIVSIDYILWYILSVLYYFTGHFRQFVTYYAIVGFAMYLYRHAFMGIF